MRKPKLKRSKKLSKRQLQSNTYHFSRKESRKVWRRFYRFDKDDHTRWMKAGYVATGMGYIDYYDGLKIFGFNCLKKHLGHLVYPDTYFDDETYLKEQMKDVLK